MSDCFGLFWEGIADSDCTKGKGCDKQNECLAKFATSTLAGFQRELGVKKSTPDALSALTSVRPEAILLAMNFQRNTAFDPYGETVIENEVEPEPQPEAAKPEPEAQPDPEVAKAEPEPQPEAAKPEPEKVEAKQTAEEPPPKKRKRGRPRKVVKTVDPESKEVADLSNQFCDKCRGTGKRGRGNCKACAGTGRAKIDADGGNAAALAKGAETLPDNSAATPGNEIETPMAGGDSRSDSADGVLHAQGKEVSDAVLASESDSGDDPMPTTNRQSGQIPGGNTSEGNANHDALERSAFLPPSLPNGDARPVEKRQVVVDLTNKRMVEVNWPGYPTLMETPYEKICQILTWDARINDYQKLVPASSNSPHEILYSALERK